MGFDELLKALRQTPSITDHPDWAAFKARPFPKAISFYYENNDGQEAYWDSMPVIKLDLARMLLILEGAHGDPLRFDVAKISQCKNADTGERVQDWFADLMIMWQDTVNAQLDTDGTSSEE